MKILIDDDKASIVFGNALRAFRAKRFPFENAVYPGESGTQPETLPLGGAEEGIFYFQNCLYMRAGIKSDQAFYRFAKFYDKHPDYFMMDYFRNDTEKRRIMLREHLRANSLGYNSEFVSNAWIHNLSKLDKYWGHDPANLFLGIKNYEDVYRRIIYTSSSKRSLSVPNGFSGFKEKISSMLMYFLMINGLIEELMFPPPIDVQLLRIMLSNRILILEKYGKQLDRAAVEYDKLTGPGRAVTLDYCLRENMNPLHLSEALWWLARTACPRNPGNRSKQIGERNGRKTIFEQEEIVWSKSQIKAVKWNCRHCPLKRTCELNVPGKTSSTRGTMELWGRRERLPQRSIFI